LTVRTRKWVGSDMLTRIMTQQGVNEENTPCPKLLLNVERKMTRRLYGCEMNTKSKALWYSSRSVIAVIEVAAIKAAVFAITSFVIYLIVSFEAPHLRPKGLHII